MKKISILTLSLLLSAFSYAKTPLSIGEIVLVDVPGANRSPLIKSLVEDSVRNSSGFELSSDSKNTLRTDLIRLENSYLIIMVLNENAKTRSRKLKIQNLDEIDTGIQRCAQALLENQELPETAKRGSVLKYDDDQNRRIKSRRGFEVSVGSAFGLSSPLTRQSGGRNSHEPMWALGFGFAWDLPKAFMETRWDILSHFGGDSGNYNAFTLGGNYIWKEIDRTAFFSGAHFGFGNSSNRSFSSGSGFHFGADTGVLFFREADVNLELRLRYMVLARQIRGELPQSLGLSLGIHL
jgi:hypothetical protein